MFACLALMAQDITFDPDASLPMDPNVIYGKLDNGLTYYIRENHLPENRAELYLVVNAGAILEDDSQDGLAHFCEHMCFNGTKNFEKKEIIEYLQSIGMKFGPEINAFTSQDNTTYMLQKVPTDDPAHIDTSLMILYDWANNVSFEDEEIDAERGVIHEEWRTGRSAMFRLMNKAQKKLYAGSKYAERDVIGDIEIVDHGPYEELRRFYSDWYRPDLQAIIAVGDFDAKEMEQQITDLFSTIPKRENPRPREEFPVPDHAETYVSIETDPEAQYNMIQLYWKGDPAPEKNMDYYRENIKQELYSSMINARLQELTLQEDPPFIFGLSMYSSVTRTKNAYVAFGIVSNEKINDGLNALLTENERLRQHGFTETELERAKANYLSSMETRFKERGKQESSSYVWEYSGHFLEGEPMPGVEFDYAFAEEIVPGITLNELNDLATDWITDENRVVVIGAPESSAEFLPTEEEVLNMVNHVDELELDAYVDKVSDAPLVAEIPEPGSIEKKYKDKKLETISWELSNGVKVVFKPTDFKDDEILMRAYSFGGTSLYDDEDVLTAQMSLDIISRSGLAGFDETELQKKLAGKVVSIWPYMSEVSEGFRGNCSPQDLETMLQLIYLYFTEPRKDEKAFKSIMSMMEGILANKVNDPSSALQDTLLVTMADYHPRVKPMTVERLEGISHSKAHYIYDERFGDPSGFTFYFVGNIDPEEAEPLILTYLGGLPKVTRNENWKDNGVRPPAETVEKEVVRSMEVPKATVSINYTGVYDYDDAMARMELATLCDILSVRYVETIREEQGGTYGVGVRESQVHYPWEHYSIRIKFDCDPENAAKLKSLVFAEIDQLMEEGPKLKDLKGVKENLLKTRTERLEQNPFWLTTIMNVDYHGYDPKGIFKYEDMVNSMTVESLKDAANRFFNTDYVEVVLLPSDNSKNVPNPVMEQ